MTQPREYRPGKTWAVTRKTVMGCARLEPKPKTNAILKFLLFHAASKTGVVLHGFEIVPNRSELLVTDREDKSAMADFLRTFHQTVAEHLAADQECPGPVWCSSGPDLTSMEGPEATLDALVEILAGAAADDLCDAPEDWFGVMSRVKFLAGREITVLRPPGVRESFPERVTLRLEKPPALERMSASEYRRELRLRLQRRTAELRAERIREGREVATRTAIESRSVLDRVETRRDPVAGRPAKCDTPAEQHAAELRIRAFRRAYRDAYRRWVRGERTVEFPHGTYAMGRFHGARVASAPG